MPQKAEEATSWPSKGSLQIESILEIHMEGCFRPPIVDPGVDSKRSCCYSTDGAQEEDDLVSPLEPGHGVGVHGVADGQVPLHGDSTPRMLEPGSIRRASGRAHGAESSI